MQRERDRVDGERKRRKSRKVREKREDVHMEDRSGGVEERKE